MSFFFFCILLLFHRVKTDFTPLKKNKNKEKESIANRKIDFFGGPYLLQN